MQESAPRVRCHIMLIPVDASSWRISQSPVESGTYGSAPGFPGCCKLAAVLHELPSFPLQRIRINSDKKFQNRASPSGYVNSAARFSHRRPQGWGAFKGIEAATIAVFDLTGLSWTQPVRDTQPAVRACRRIRGRLRRRAAELAHPVQQV